MTPQLRSPWIVCLTAAVIGIGVAMDGATFDSQIPASSGPISVVIDDPTAGLPISGSTHFLAHVEPASTGVRNISFVVDGVVLCTAPKEPFECTRDVGVRAQARKVVAVAVLADGRRVNGTRETTATDFVDSTTARAVNIPVIVTSANGSPVKGLTKDQFEIRDEGRLQEITFFTSEDPLTHVVVALDHSESMRRSLDQLKSAANKFMDAFKQPNKVTLAAFNHDFNVLTYPNPEHPETDQARRHTALQGLQAVGGSALYDAIYSSLVLPTESGALKAVVVFSDGDDIHSQSDSKALAQIVRGTSAAVYMVIRRSGPRSRDVRRAIEDFVKMSGGRWLEVENARDIQDAFALISSVLEHQYLIGFTPEQVATGPRRLSVTIKGQPKLTILAKTEYGPRR